MVSRKVPLHILRGQPCGFTLVELVMVLVVIGALAAIALPRMLDLSMWRLRAYADQAQSATMFAGRLALSQRQPIRVAFSATGLAITYVNGGAAIAIPGVSLACPSATPSCIVSGAGTNVVFNAVNAGSAVTSTGGALTVAVASGRSFTIENETGLVHK